jgi:hypothetical protein
MCPLAYADGFDAFWLIDKLVPGFTPMIDDGRVPGGGVARDWPPAIFR